MAEKRNKHSGPKTPEFKPEYTQAFMIKMLHIVGIATGKREVSLTLEQLEMFVETAGDVTVTFDYDEKTKTATLKAPDYEMPGSNIIQPKSHSIFVN